MKYTDIIVKKEDVLELYPEETLDPTFNKLSGIEMDLEDFNRDFDPIIMKIGQSCIDEMDKAIKQAQKNGEVDVLLSKPVIRNYMIEALKKEGIWDKYPHLAGFLVCDMADHAISLFNDDPMEKLQQMMAQMGKQNLA